MGSRQRYSELKVLAKKLRGRYRKKRIAVAAGGWGSEREVSLRSGKAIFKSLQTMGHEVTYLDITEKNWDRIAWRRYDLVFNIIHGRWGEDGSFQGYLDLKGVPYAGAGIGASYLAMDKFRSRLLFKGAGIKTPPCQFVERGDADLVGRVRVLKPPYVVKPNNEGSSVGITMTSGFQDTVRAVKKKLKEFPAVLIEERLQGREINLSVIGDRAPITLPPLEVRPKAGFYSYRAKYTPGETEYICPTHLLGRTQRRIEEAGKRAYTLLGTKGFARMEFILVGNTPFLLEVNTLPGFTETSLLPKSAAVAGITFYELVLLIFHFSEVR